MTPDQTIIRNKFKRFTVLTVCSVLAAGFAVLFEIACAAEKKDAVSVAETGRLANAQRVSAIKIYRDILSFPNDAAHPSDILKLVEWLEPQFSSRGFETRRINTDGSPLVFAERKVESGEKTALIYLQADGQPVDPSKWDQPNPYAATLKKQNADGTWREIDWPKGGDLDPGWRIFARSASDSKGPIAQFFSAIDEIDKAGITPRFNIKVIVDTEEELGSPHLRKALLKNDALLRANFMLVFDGPPHTSNKPTIVFGARGLTTITLTTYGPENPQHSGHYGNYAPNPAFHLARILGSMKDIDGRVLIDGYYDGVAIGKSARHQLEAVPDDKKRILSEMKLATIDKVGTMLQEALQYPSLNIRGLSSGWTGAEARTIIPAIAVAEVDIRTTPETDPARLINLIDAHIRRLGYYLINRAPTDEERYEHAHIVSMTHKTNYYAFRTDYDSLAGEIAQAGMRCLYEEEPILIRMLGGSSPIAIFADILKLPLVLVPTVNIDNNQHAPNENIRVGNYFEGIAMMASILSYDLTSYACQWPAQP